MHLGTLGSTPPDPALSLSDVARSYKYLAKHIDSIDVISRDAYLALFGTELPDIVKTTSQVRRINAPERFR